MSSLRIGRNRLGLVFLATLISAPALAQSVTAPEPAAEQPPPSAATASEPAPAAIAAAPPAPPETAHAQPEAAAPEEGPIETESTVAEPGPVSPPSDASSLPSWMRHVKLGGGAILYYYQPFDHPSKNDLSFFYGRLDLDVDAGAFGIHLEPRFRDAKLRPFFDGPAWIEEGYGSWTFGPFATLKVGKIYSRLGLFWDNSFYGNVQVYDGLKLAPDYGASLEGSLGDRIGLNYWAQFFLVDGRTNVSLQGRDTVSVPGARRRDEVVVNVEPFVKFGEDGLFRIGVSLEHLKADLPSDPDQVLRLAAHTKLTVANFGFWGELLHQKGRHVSDFPFAGTPAIDGQAAQPGRASGDNTYFELGAEYTFADVTLRYNVSYANYADVHVHEVLHVPAISYKLATPLTILAELVFWRRYSSLGDSNVDKSLNVTLLGNF